MWVFGDSQFYTHMKWIHGQVWDDKCSFFINKHWSLCENQIDITNYAGTDSAKVHYYTVFAKAAGIGAFL